MRKRIVAADRKQSLRQAVDIQYHVVWSPRLRAWHIERNGHAIGERSSHKSYVVRWAIHRAHEDHKKDLDAVVCVQQLDGTYRLEWSHGDDVRFSTAAARKPCRAKFILGPKTGFLGDSGEFGSEVKPL